MNSSPELQEQVSKYHPGDKITVTYVRNDKERVANVTLKNKEGKAIEDKGGNMSVQYLSYCTDHQIYLFFFLWRFFLNLFFRLCVAIL